MSWLFVLRRYVTLALLLFSFQVFAETPQRPPALEDLTIAGLRQAMVAFVSLSTTPGIESATFDVDSPFRQSELSRSSLGFGAEITLNNYGFNGFWGAAISTGNLDDDIDFIDRDDNIIQLQLNRDILSLRGSAGLSFPITQRLKIRPYISFVGARLDSESFLVEKQPVGAPNDKTPLESFTSGVNTLTTTGTLEALYNRWYDDYRLELSGNYTIAYTDVMSSTADFLDSETWGQVSYVRARFSGPLTVISDSGLWRWNTYLNHTNFFDLETEALGFNSYFEAGVGVELEWRVKPLDMFSLEAVGFRVGGIFGDDVSGFNIGITVR
ncbi:MAG: hypothetical protein V7711_03070 [Pseudomonadales bacterium]